MTRWRSIWMRAISHGNATADPTQETLQVWYIEQKTAKRKQVEFTLNQPDGSAGVAPAPAASFSLHWCIRGKYRSGRWLRLCRHPLLRQFNNPVDDPSLDECSGTLTRL
jgi:lambda family phage minor tail protein L